MRAAGGAILGLCAACALCACGSPRPGPRSLSVTDFRDPIPDNPDAPDVASAPRPAQPPAPRALLDGSMGFGPDLGPTGALRVVARAGPPDAPEAPRTVSSMAIVDEIVGEINTKPIYAVEFLSTMADRMRQVAEEAPPDEWRRFARMRIHQELRARLHAELILADSYAQLPPAHRQGLSVILDDLLRRDRSAQRGSEALVERELREQNSTLGQQRQDRREKLLIDLRYREWWQQVHVSADEVELAYERDYEKYNPDPRAIFRRIRIYADDEEAVARIQRRLDAGEPFAVVAEDPANLNSPEEGGLIQGVGSFPGGYQEATFFASEPLNEAVRGLTEGQWGGPVESGTTVSWLYLERIERHKVSLFDARPQIRRQLEQERFLEVQDAEFRTMMARSSFTDLEVMTDKLLVIAERWYLAPVIAARSAPTPQRAGQGKGSGAGSR